MNTIQELRQPFLTVEQVTLNVGGAAVFADTNWAIQTDQHWALIGPNGSGKSMLARAICHEIPLVRGRILYYFDHAQPARAYFNRGEIVRIAPEAQRSLLQPQDSYYQARWQSFEGNAAPTVSDILTGESLERISPYDVSPMKTKHAVYQARRQAAVALLGIEYLLARKILHLSNGEAQKVLLARALMQAPRLLILDDPFRGLDNLAREALQRIIADVIAAHASRLILITPRLEEIPPGITHVLEVAAQRIRQQQPRLTVNGITLRKDTVRPELVEGRNSRFDKLSTNGGALNLMSLRLTSATHSAPEQPSDEPLPQFPSVSRQPDARYSILVDLQDTSVAYQGVNVLQGITWTMRPGENWAVLGPNGAGKTTLLSLILADNPQAYANTLTLFDRRRGSGESIWDIKQHIGWVSPELQLYYQADSTCQQVVYSGFFDSIGLYHACSAEQAAAARQWIAALGIAPLADRPFSAVSTGEQRLVLLTRALVKNPVLLILDEPCQGLDSAHRTRLLALLDQLCARTTVNLIYVTHHFDELPTAITHVLKLARGRIQASGRRQNILGG